MKLTRTRYRTVEAISGPLIFLREGDRFPQGAILEIVSDGGLPRRGQVLETSRAIAVVQVLGRSDGLDLARTTVRLRDEVARVGVSPELVGRVLTGMGEPRDDLPPPLAAEWVPVNGAPMNPVMRRKPEDFIETGLTSMDLFNTLVRGQKLPIFSAAGLPCDEIAARVLRDATFRGQEEDFLIVFAAIGITRREADFFRHRFEASGALDRTVALLNLADDPSAERLITPRAALAVAEYFAFGQGREVLVILTDMTNYCQALREIGAAREEVPGRRGYPGYMYSDLASLYERAGMLRDRRGSITMLPILTMPDDDITHPIVDLTGYITEGQIVLSRSLHRIGVWPPIDVLPSLSRLMNNGIGAGRTREDHRALADQLYACYASGVDVRSLVAVVGRDALSDLDRTYLAFAERFETELIHQGDARRSIEASLDAGWGLLRMIPKDALRRLSRDLISKYFSKILEDGTEAPFP